MTVVGEAEIVILANTSGFRKDLEDASGTSFTSVSKDAEKAGEDIGGNLEKGAKSKLSGFKNTLGSFGVPESLLSGKALGIEAFAAAGVAALHFGIDMQSATTSIATSAGISTQAAERIGNAFIGTAGKTEFSGIAMAKAFAGVAGQLKATQGSALNVSQANEFMSASMDLATAKQIDLGTATSTVAGIMQAFQLKTQDAAHITDVLFNASNATGQGIDTLGASLEKVRSKLGALSPPIGDLAGLLLSMTKNGVTGRAALSALNTAMTGLQGAATGTTKANVEGRDALASMGVSATTSTGQITPLATIIDGLAPKFAKMTQAQQIATAASIFGASAARQMTAVIDAGAKAFDAATKSVNKHGSAQEAAAKQSKTLAVQFKTVTATVEDVATSLGSVLVPALGMLMKVLMPVIDAFVWLAQKIVNNKPLFYSLAAVLFATMIPALYGMVAGMVTATADAIVMGTTFVATWAAILGPVALVLAAIALVAGIVYEVVDHWSAIAHFFEKLWDDVVDLFKRYWKIALEIILGPIAIIIFHWHAIEDFFTGLFHDVVDFIKKHWELIVEIITGPIGWIVALWRRFGGDVENIFDDIWHWIQHVWDDISNGALELTIDILDFFKALPGKILKVVEDGASDVMKAFEKYVPGGGLIGGAIGGIAHLFGEGGIVTRPTLGIIGEKGPEAVIPLSKFGVSASEASVRDLATSTTASSAGGGGNVQHGDLNLYVNQPLNAHELIVELGYLMRSGELSQIGIG